MSTLRVNNLKSRTGTAVTITSGHGLDVEGNLKITGVSTFSGITSFTNGANVTGVTTFEQASFAQNAEFTGILTAKTFHGNITGVAATFSGALTYEDVTNVDAIGIVTAREGILVGAGKSVGIGTVTPGVPLEVHSTDATGAFINVKSKSDTLAGIQFGDFQDDNIGAIKYSNGSNTLRIFANAGEKYRIGEAGQFGIGGATYGTSGQVLTSGGASAAPTWADNQKGILQYANATKVNTQGVDYNAGRTVISGLNVTLPNAVQSNSKIFVSGHMTTGYSGGDPGMAPRWEYSADNSSWASVQLSTYAVAGSHAGLDANSNWGVGSGYQGWSGNTWTVNNNSLSMIVTASEVSQARYYRVTVRQTDSSNNTVYVNRHGESTDGFAPVGTSSLVIMELANI